MPMGGEVLRKHPRALRKIVQRLDSLRGIEVIVGYQGATGRAPVVTHDGNGNKSAEKLRYAELGAIHHFGAPRAKIPARKHMGVLDDEDLFRKIARTIGREVLRGDPARAATRGAIKLESVIRNRIWRLRLPKLAARTIAARRRRRGDSTPNPLVDTGGMMGAVTGVAKINGLAVYSGTGKKGGRP